MTFAPLRPEVVGTADVSQDNYTIREAIEWHKDLYKAGISVDVLAEQEADYMNKQWVEIVRRTAKDQKLPHGPLSQFLSSVSLMECMQEVAAEVIDEQS